MYAGLASAAYDRRGWHTRQSNQAHQFREALGFWLAASVSLKQSSTNCGVLGADKLLAELVVVQSPSPRRLTLYSIASRHTQLFVHPILRFSELGVLV
jgi:hypothetical protein